MPYTLDQFCALYIQPILCFIHWTNSVPYTLDQFCALYIQPILCFIHWTNSVPYTLDQFRALYVGPILCFIHWTNSKALLVLTQGFPDEGTPGVPKHDTYRNETVYRLFLRLEHEQML